MTHSMLHCLRFLVDSLKLGPLIHVLGFGFCSPVCTKDLFLCICMAPHGNAKDDGSQDPAPISPGGTYSIQVRFCVV